jgi:hypothetical protein
MIPVCKAEVPKSGTMITTRTPQVTAGFLLFWQPNYIFAFLFRIPLPENVKRNLHTEDGHNP